MTTVDSFERMTEILGTAPRIYERITDMMDEIRIALGSDADGYDLPTIASEITSYYGGPLVEIDGRIFQNKTREGFYQSVSEEDFWTIVAKNDQTLTRPSGSQG